MVKRHLNHEIAKVSNLLRDNERSLNKKTRNLDELTANLAQVEQNFSIGDYLNDMSRRLNSLLSEMKKKKASMDRVPGHKSHTQPKTRSAAFEPTISTPKPANARAEPVQYDQGYNDETADEFEEVSSQEGEEEPEKLISQLDGYIKSTNMENKDPFNEILHSTHDLVNHLPNHGKGNKQLNEFITSLESCVGAFT